MLRALVNNLVRVPLAVGFVEGLRRHVERVLCFVQVVDDDGAALERHEENLAYSPFVRL